MPLEDLSDPNRFNRKMKKDVKRGPVRSGGGGDTGHAGDALNAIKLGLLAIASGIRSLAFGPGTKALGYGSAALGDSAEANADYAAAVASLSRANGAQSLAAGKSSTAEMFGGTAVGGATYAGKEKSGAFGYGAFSNHESSSAIGTGATTTADLQIMLGKSTHTVVVAGTLSTPSARRLKRRIKPAPRLVSIFFPLYEWEYKADKTRRRHIGPIADELVGTDAERFLTFDAKGRVSGIDKVGLYGAQIAALHAENTELRVENNELRERMTALENLVRGQHG
jgi:hypothetical protein